MKKSIRFLSITFAAAALSILLPSAVKAATTQEVYNEALSNRIKYQAMYDEYQKALDYAQSQYDYAVASTCDQAIIEKNALNLECARNQLRWAMDQLNNAENYVSHCEARAQQDAKNKIAIVNSRMQNVADLEKAIADNEKIANENKYINSLNEELLNSLNVSRAHATVEAYLSTKSGLSDWSKGNYSIDKYAANYVKLSTLPKNVRSAYAKYLNGEALSDTEASKVTSLTQKIKDNYADWRIYRDCSPELRSIFQGIDENIDAAQKALYDGKSLKNRFKTISVSRDTASEDLRALYTRYLTGTNGEEFSTAECSTIFDLLRYEQSLYKRYGMDYSELHGQEIDALSAYINATEKYANITEDVTLSESELAELKETGALSSDETWLDDDSDYWDDDDTEEIIFFGDDDSDDSDSNDSGSDDDGSDDDDYIIIDED